MKHIKIKAKLSGNAKKILLFSALLPLFLFLIYTSLRFYIFIKIPWDFNLRAEDKAVFERKLDYLYPERKEALHYVSYELPLPSPRVSAVSALLLDFETGDVLFEKDADKVIPPASLTKLFSMYVVLSLVESGEVKMEDEVPLPPSSWASRMPPHSSLMFLGKNQRVTVQELLTGLAVSSGNDAAYALAFYMAGSMEKFIELMNGVASSLNLTHTHFVESSGYSEKNTTTAREMAAFARTYIARFPYSLKLFHSLPSFSYPKKHNLAAEDSDEKRAQDFSSGIPDEVRMEIYQENTNPLLGKLDGADGLKTGYIDESGYNLILTVKRGNMRIISVTLGGKGRNLQEGQMYRSSDGRALTEYAFSSFMNLELKDERKQYTLRSLYASPSVLTVVPLYERNVLCLPLSLIKEESSVHRSVYLPQVIRGKVREGERVGRVEYSISHQILFELPLVSEMETKNGSIFSKAADAIIDIFY